MCDSECVAPAVVSPLAPASSANGMQPASSPCDAANIGNLVEAINPAVQLASSLSAHSMQHSTMQSEVQPAPPVGCGGGGSEYISPQELEMENHWLREKLKEVTADRDRLLCEVSNLRLELDMAELKRLPEHRKRSFYRPTSIFGADGANFKNIGRSSLCGTHSTDRVQFMKRQN
uniref:Uncharacterized protein n=1 Tax=Anopheles culicifacies TaxID=139723 RepID=A0A182LRG5_9DIPT